MDFDSLGVAAEVGEDAVVEFAVGNDVGVDELRGAGGEKADGDVGVLEVGGVFDNVAFRARDFVPIELEGIRREVLHADIGDRDEAGGRVLGMIGVVGGRSACNECGSKERNEAKTKGIGHKFCPFKT